MDETAILQAILEKVTGMESDISEIRQRVTKIETTQEQVTNKKIQLLIEAQAETKAKMERLDEVASRVEDIQITVRAMETITKQNNSDIRDLRLIK